MNDLYHNEPLHRLSSTEGSALSGESSLSSALSPSLLTPTEDSPPTKEHKLSFDGDPTDLLLLKLRNFGLAVITLGIYYFWGKAAQRRWIWSHWKVSTQEGGAWTAASNTHLTDTDRFEYTGTGWELLIGALKAGALYFLFMLALRFFPLVLQFFPKETTLEGPYLKLIFAFALLAFFALTGSLVLPALGFLMRRYRLSRTHFRGLSFGMDIRKLRSYVAHTFLDTLLVWITFGLYYPWYRVAKHRRVIEATHYGSKSFTYTGRAEDLVSEYILMILLFPFTLGLSTLRLAAFVHRYDLEHTQLDGISFSSTLTGMQLLRITLAHWAAALLTLGFGLPWVICFSYRITAATTAIKGDFVSPTQAQDAALPGSLTEGLGEWVQIDGAF